MPSIYKAFWNIPNAGPSVSTFAAQATLQGDAQEFANRVRTLLLAMVSYLPDEVTISFDTEVTFVDPSTGVLTGSTAVTQPQLIAGTSTAAWAAGTGARIVWATDTIRNGRRVRGSTFLVPLTSVVNTAGGLVGGSARTAIQTAAQAYLTGMAADGNPVYVYSRPVPGRPGATTVVTAASVPEIPATLRTRKA